MRHMARRYRAPLRHRAKSFLSFGNIAKFIKVGALVAPAVYVAIGTSGSPQDKVVHGLQLYTGYNVADGTFNPMKLVEGWGPYVVTSLVTTGIGKINGMIRRF